MSSSLLQEHIFDPLLPDPWGSAIYCLPSLQLLEPEDVVVMAEVWSEASYVKHHSKNRIFSARCVILRLIYIDAGRDDYIELTDSENSQSLVGEVERLQIAHQFDAWYVTEPGEWRLKNEFEALVSRIPVPFEICPDKRFICSHEEFNEFLKGRNNPGWSTFIGGSGNRQVY